MTKELSVRFSEEEYGDNKTRVIAAVFDTTYDADEFLFEIEIPASKEMPEALSEWLSRGSKEYLEWLDTQRQNPYNLIKAK